MASEAEFAKLRAEREALHALLSVGARPLNHQDRIEWIKTAAAYLQNAKAA